MNQKITVNPDQFNKNAVEVDVFGETTFSLLFDDAEILAEDLKRTVSTIIAARRLQNWIEGKELGDGRI